MESAALNLKAGLKQTGFYIPAGALFSSDEAVKDIYKAFTGDAALLQANHRRERVYRFALALFNLINQYQALAAALGSEHIVLWETISSAWSPYTTLANTYLKDIVNVFTRARMAYTGTATSTALTYAVDQWITLLNRMRSRPAPATIRLPTRLSSTNEPNLIGANASYQPVNRSALATHPLYDSRPWVSCKLPRQ